MKKGVLKNFTKFTGKYLCQSLFFNKGLKPATLLKKRLAQLFSFKFSQIFKNTFFTEHLWTTASVKYTYLFYYCLQSKLLCTQVT